MLTGTLGRLAQRLPPPLFDRLFGAAAKVRWRERPPRRAGIRPRVVDRYDAVADRSATFAAVTSALEGAGIAHVALAGGSSARPLLAIAREDRSAALDVLAAALGADGWAIAPSAGATGDRHALAAAVRADAVADRSLDASSVLVFRLQAAAGGRVLAGPGTGCTVQFWARIDAPHAHRRDGGTHDPGTRLAAGPAPVAYLTPGTWAAATRAADRRPPGLPPALCDVDFPIDLVYTWVDGTDPAWRARKDACAAAETGNARNRTAAHDSRFAAHDELRYSLRSVAMYASWVRRIHLVTDGQVPAWLNTDHPRLRVVDHREIFTDSGGLPVFNSHAIESQLHHIPDLAEHYLYLNDDMFLGRPVRPELFFLGNGLARFFPSTKPLDVDPPTARDLPVMSAAKVNRALLEQRFGAAGNHKFLHAPYAQRRSVLEELERDFPDVFARVARSRFRHPDDISVPSSLSHYYAFGLGKAVPGSLSYMYEDIAAPGAAVRLRVLLHKRYADAFCLNDHETAPAQQRAAARTMTRFLQQYFPLPGPYELA